jgi:hypothetical protein
LPTCGGQGFLYQDLLSGAGQLEVELYSDQGPEAWRRSPKLAAQR